MVYGVGEVYSGVNLMRVLFINEVCGHTSTGKICAEQAEKMALEGNEVRIAYGRDDFVPEHYQKYAIRIGNRWSVLRHVVMTRIFDKHGLGSKAATRKFIKWAELFDPDLIWLHNIHGYYVNYEILFEWIKGRPQTEVKWTFHDCWPFTGHCVHYTYTGCDKWKKECNNCNQKKEYPASLLLDNSTSNYHRKKKNFTGVERLSIITPSHWLAEQVKQSFLQNYPTTVIHNKIDKETFKPSTSNFRKEHNLIGKCIVLGVANVWNDRKGINDFFKLASLLGNKAVIVLVGLSKKQVNRLPDNIIGITHTRDQKELASLYSTSDWFVNMTYEDTFPTVNLEAEACGTRVITYDVGGCAETITLPCSRTVHAGNINEIAQIILGEIKQEIKMA